MVGREQYASIEVNRSDTDVLTVTLNRPDALNAVDERLHKELSTVFWDVAQEPHVGAVVITGKGKAFSAGGDFELLTRLRSDPDLASRMTTEGAQIVDTLLAIRAPVVAAVNGPAVGLGATIALLCDVVFMSRSAVLADPHVKVGLAAGDGGALIWPSLVGLARAKSFLLTGDAVSADEAERIGLVSHVVEDGEVLDRARAFADRLAAGSRTAVQATKEAVNAELRRRAAELMPLSLALEGRTMAMPDVEEGSLAAQEKRAPVWPSHAR